jgi:o-succinylbenzoate---CoA ligase
LTSESILCPLARLAADVPESPAIIADERAITFSELSALAASFERWIDAEGVHRGSVLAVHGRSSPEYVALLVAALRLGVIFAPLSTRLPTALATTQARDIGAARIIDPREIAASLLSTLSPPDRSWDQPARWLLDAPSTAVYTSGSTGRPRAAVHSVRNHLISAEGSRKNISLDRGGRWLLSLPMYHVGGLAIVFRCLLSGASIVISERDADDAIEAHGITHASFVPTQLQRILASSDANLRSLRAVLLGGSQIPAPLIDRALEAGVPIHTSYGLTEMASQVSTTRPGASSEELRTAGFVLPGREVKIDADGRIKVRGGTRFLGFAEGSIVDTPLDSPFDTEGWYTTGDVGRFDEWNRLVVLGRGDQVFISGGENIHPAQIEKALLELSGVRDAVVVPLEDAEFGFRPVAFIDSAANYDLESVRRSLSEKLPRFMLPVALYDLPAPGGLKHDRAQLADVARRDRHVAP